MKGVPKTTYYTDDAMQAFAGRQTILAVERWISSAVVAQGFRLSAAAESPTSAGPAMTNSSGGNPATLATRSWFRQT
jgi:hypothetical protein